MRLTSARSIRLRDGRKEAKMIFGFSHHEKANRIYNVILWKLTPLAIRNEKSFKEAERRRKEEERQEEGGGGAKIA